MKSFRLYVMTLFASAISLGPVQAAERPCAIVPQPQHVSWQTGSFSLSQASISYGKTRNGREAALWLQDMTRRVTGRTLPIVKGDKGTIRLAIQPDGNSAAAGDNPRGSYTLHVTDQLVSVTGTDYPSLVNGLASLVQLMQGGKIDCVEITDAPRFAWRGFHLDCSRHFYTKEEVEEIIRLASLYKMNRFHWHLTDDQGWRIEIKRYPELTAKSAWRHFNYQDSTCMRQARLQDNPDLLIPASKLKIVGTDTLYGGFYTQKDIKEVVAFAKRCGVEVVPEIDMPGHRGGARHLLLPRDRMGQGVLLSPMSRQGDDAGVLPQRVERSVPPLPLWICAYRWRRGGQGQLEEMSRLPEAHRRQLSEE